MNCFNQFLNCLKNRPLAYAMIRGSDKFPEINGRVDFFGLKDEVLVRAEIHGLPKGEGKCAKPIFAFHIHDGTQCRGNMTDNFADTHGHYNPNNCLHPYHAGDLPPLFGVNGKAFLTVLTDRFSISEIIGKTIIIHSNPDVFKTQPSGDAGEKMACGVIKR